MGCCRTAGCPPHPPPWPRGSGPASCRRALRSRRGGWPAAPRRPPPMAIAGPVYARVAWEAVYVAELAPAPASRGSAAYDGLPLGNAAGTQTAAELVGRGPTGMTSCHQCRKVGAVLWCSSCDRRGYCAGCISRCSITSGLAS
ncbi:hypothetical protein PAHAL_2G179900 [Panicum hallii]|uniref:Uncharacterized protein n=1 Tax=Panicum hallii TaxID=206008 RepID=A0A2T8KPK8_9POAL|nr:hypothetical protein PAHAL_2G179900 [Panicum hallii]